MHSTIKDNTKSDGEDMILKDEKLGSVIALNYFLVDEVLVVDVFAPHTNMT